MTRRYRDRLRGRVLAGLLALSGAGIARAHICNDMGLGLTSRWSAEADAVDPIGSNTGTLVNGAGFAPGPIGLAFAFDGVDDLVDVPDSAGLDPVGCSFALEGWIRTARAAGIQVVAGKYECSRLCKAGLSNSLFALRLHDGRLEAELRDSDAGGSAPDGGQVLTGTTPLADGRCHHVAMVRDVDLEELRLYVDGRLEASAALDAGGSGDIQDDDASPDPFTIGARYLEGTSTPTETFAGLVDELGLYNRSLSGAQVADIFRAAGKLRCGVKPPKRPRGGSSAARARPGHGPSTLDFGVAPTAP